MRTKLFLILIVGLFMAIMPQSMKVTKTDGSTVIFKLADIDSLMISSTSSAKAVSADGWKCIDGSSSQVSLPAPGIFEDAVEGLKVFGSSSLGPVKLIPVQGNILTNKTIYLRWQISSGNVETAVTLFGDRGCLLPLCKGFPISAEPAVVKAGTWYYTRIRISNCAAESVTAEDNFDNNGGKTIAAYSVPVSSDVYNYSFETTGDKHSYSILGEARVE